MTTPDHNNKSGGGTGHKRFRYASKEEFLADLKRLAPSIPFQEDMVPLKQELVIGKKTVPNRLAIHPMEGADGESDGSPSDLTRRRYLRFASGGAGLLWFEACAVVPDGKANPRQLHINKDNVGAYRSMLADSLAAAKDAGFPRPYTVLQLTHSGRQSRPGPQPAPIIAAVNPILDRVPGRVITDAELEALQAKFVEAAVLAHEAGFDAVDIKACHGYLLGELLAAHERPGKFGGSFENRTRFMLEVIDAVKAKLGDRIDIGSRLGVFDSVPYPHGWGVSREEYHTPNFSEPVALVKLMQECGVKLIDVTCGNPYFNPHVNRPFDQGFYTPPQHQMQGAEILLNAAKVIQAAVPQIAVLGTGLSWFRQYGANIASAMVAEGWCAVAGFGRQSFAYPDFASDILTKGALDPARCCIACGNCTQMMRDGEQAGCMVRDRDVYAAIYKKGRAGKPPVDMSHIAEHV